jgi:hypothetical protein
MVLLLTIVGIWAMVCAGFLAAMVLWSLRKTRYCSCGGSLARVDMIHSPAMCFPAQESLDPYVHV